MNPIVISLESLHFYHATGLCHPLPSAPGLPGPGGHQPLRFELLGLLEQALHRVAARVAPQRPGPCVGAGGRGQGRALGVTVLAAAGATCMVGYTRGPGC